LDDNIKKDVKAWDRGVERIYL